MILRGVSYANTLIAPVTSAYLLITQGVPCFEAQGLSFRATRRYFMEIA